MLYKLKDNISSKELENIGYEDYGVCYKKYYFGGCQIFIDKSDKKIRRLHPYSFREEPNEQEIQDLIQADLVEKV